MFNHKCVGLAFRQDDLYLLSLCENMNAVSTKNENASSSMNTRNKQKRIHDVSSKLWHCRLCHISRGGIERLTKKSILLPLEFLYLE
jgi:ribosomal protein L37AE/L43A